MTDSAIQIRDLHVMRGSREVLKGLDLDLPKGRITGLLGPSGCGKTTLMRSIVGVQVVESGTVTVLGVPAGSAVLRRRVGYVTQAPSVYDDLSIAANLRYFGRLYGASNAAAEKAIDAVGLGREREKLVRNLSGGQRARVSLATVLVGDPELLVLDEPTVGLDPVLRAELWEMFRRLADGGATLLVSSHVMDEAERCDELLLMREGDILSQSSPRELLETTHCPSVEEAFLQLVSTRSAAA